MQKMKIMSEQILNKSKRWQTVLIDVITDPEELFDLLDLDKQFLVEAQKAVKLFPLKVPREFISRMQKGNFHDPLLRQILPIDAEWNLHPEYETDPLKEKIFNPVPGLLHKYKNRVLLTLTSACGINCRFCFRRHFPYSENNPGTGGWNRIIEYIQENPSIHEVILSGGDPLTLNDRALKAFKDQLSLISHIKRLRIHSRMPIVIPERVSDELLDWICDPALTTILVVHCNHPNEINELVKKALEPLKSITLLNQSVLLRGVNDNVATLVALSEKLFEAGILPYYLHLKDKTQGTAHFEVDLPLAKKLHQEMLSALPGYLVPKWVLEQPGEPSKTYFSAFTQA